MDFFKKKSWNFGWARFFGGGPLLSKNRGGRGGGVGRFPSERRGGPKLKKKQNGAPHGGQHSGGGPAIFARKPNAYWPAFSFGGARGPKNGGARAGGGRGDQYGKKKKINFWGVNGGLDLPRGASRANFFFPRWRHNPALFPNAVPLERAWEKRAVLCGRKIRAPPPWVKV